MENIYKDWDTFIANIDIVPEQLDKEKFSAMISGLSRSHEEREALRKEACTGDKAAFDSLVNSYIPVIAEAMRRCTSNTGYNRDVLLSCIEQVRGRITNSLRICNDGSDFDFDYDIFNYIGWVVRNTLIPYIVSSRRE